MMEKLKTTLWMMVLTCSLSACKKDDPGGPCVLKTLSDNAGGPTITSLYQIDNFGYLTATSQVGGTNLGTVETTYGFDASNHVSDVTNADGSQTHAEQWFYTDGLVTKIISLGDNPSTITFTYDTGNKLISYSSISAKKTEETGEFTYEQGNVISAKITYNANIPALVETVVNKYSGYDTHPNPFLLLAKALGNQVFLPSSSSPVVSEISQNNYTKASIGPSQYNLTYSYNESGYPTKILTQATTAFVATEQDLGFVNCR